MSKQEQSAHSQKRDPLQGHLKLALTPLVARAEQCSSRHLQQAPSAQPERLRKSVREWVERAIEGDDDAAKWDETGVLFKLHLDPAVEALGAAFPQFREDVEAVAGEVRRKKRRGFANCGWENPARLCTDPILKISFAVSRVMREVHDVSMERPGSACRRRGGGGPQRDRAAPRRAQRAPLDGGLRSARRAAVRTERGSAI